MIKRKVSIKSNSCCKFLNGLIPQTFPTQTPDGRLLPSHTTCVWITANNQKGGTTGFLNYGLLVVGSECTAADCCLLCLLGTEVCNDITFCWGGTCTGITIWKEEKKVNLQHSLSEVWIRSPTGIGQIGDVIRSQNGSDPDLNTDTNNQMEWLHSAQVNFK